MTNRRGRPPHDDILTPSEWAIADAVRHGMTNAQIATRQGVSRDAIKFHLSNMLLKLGLAGRAELKHSTCIPKTSALHKRELKEMLQGELEMGKIGQISRMVRDIEEAKRFYGEVVGLPELYSFSDMAFFDMKGTRLYLHQKAEVAAESVLYFCVDDIMTAHAQLGARGANFTGAPHMVHKHPDGTEEWFAFFTDPEGRLLALMSAVAPAQK